MQRFNGARHCLANQGIRAGDPISCQDNMTSFQESILPNFDFFIYPIFIIKLVHFKIPTILSFIIYYILFILLLISLFFCLPQTLKLNNKKWKRSLFYEEKSLVGLTLRYLKINFKL